MNSGLHRSREIDLPKRFGRYEAFSRIGSGGMAHVYLAVDRNAVGTPNELAVVKVLRRDDLDDERLHASFLDEARMAMRLLHPNVIRTRDAVATPPDYLLAMEFLAGQSLLEVLRRIGRANVPLDEHLFILTQVLAGLSHAHELRDEDGQSLGIVHRDVSPSNVLVSYDGRVKLLDFGIAKATGAEPATRDGIVQGKVGYAAPEQCLGKPVDPRSDVYAVGVMLWEAIAGRRRAMGETWQSVLHGRIEGTELDIEDACSDVPLALSAATRRALGHDPEARYSTARELREDLTAYLTCRSVSVGPERIAALLRPHFDRDRAEQREAIDAYLAQRGRSVSGTRRRTLPPLFPPVSPAVTISTTNDAEEEEEDTSPIPVDDALLLQSMRDSIPGNDDATHGGAPSAPGPLSARELVSVAPFGRKRLDWPTIVAMAAAVASAAALVVSISRREPVGSDAAKAPAPSARDTASAPSAVTTGTVTTPIPSSSATAEPGTPEASPRAPKGSGRPRGARVRAVASQSPRQPSEPRVAPAGVEPGMDLQPRSAPRGKRTLDEKDPYGP